MSANSYAGVVEPEIAHLVVTRAKRLRLRKDEIDDLQQQIVPKLAAFRFDSARSNGASPVTAMTALIDRQMKAYLRAKRRYDQRIGVLQVMSGASVADRLKRQDSVAQPEPVDLRMDLEDAMAGMSDRDRAICGFLANGLSINAIAQRLACGRDTIGRAVARIRRKFTAAGIRAWVDPDCAAAARPVGENR